MRRPATRLRALAARFFRAHTMERLIDPTISDLQSEYDDAVSRGRRWEAITIWMAGHTALLRVLALHGCFQLIETLRGWPGDDSRAVIRTIAASSAIVLVGTVALAMVPFANFASRDYPRPELAFYLVPQALAVCIPVGLMFGILCGIGQASASRRTRSAVALLALGACFVSFTMAAWVVPISNQAFRVSSAGIDLPKGESELTLSELRQRLESAVAAGASDSYRVALNYHARWAWGAAPLTLAAFAVAFTTRRRAVLMSFVAGCVAIFIYWVLIVAGRELGLDGTISPLAAAWVPNTAFLLFAVTMMRFSSYRT